MHSILLCRVLLVCSLGLVAGKSSQDSLLKRPPAKNSHGKPHPMTPKSLRQGEDTLDRSLKERKGPWTEARAKALSLDDRARVLQDKGRLFKDRAALASARSSKSPDKSAMEAYDRSQLISDRSRLLEDKSHLYGDRAKILQGKETLEEHLEPDVPRSEQANVQHDREALLKNHARMEEDKALLLRDSGHLVADYGEHVTGTKGMSRAMVSAVAEDKGLLHQDHVRLRKDFGDMHRDRYQLERDEHSTVLKGSNSKVARALSLYNHASHRPNTRQGHGAAEMESPALTSGHIKMVLAACCGVVLVLMGLVVLYRQQKLTRDSDSEDRIPLKSGDPRAIPRGDDEMRNFRGL